MPNAGVGVALRRVIVGYRVVGVLWLWLLAIVVMVTDPGAHLGLVVATGAAATAWTALTVWLGLAAPMAFRSPLWLAADIAVAAGLLVVSTAAGADRGFTGGYPFSAVLLSAYAAGLPGGVSAAVVLSAVSLVRLGAGEAIGSTLVYLAGAGVTVWAIDVIRRNEAQRVALEQRLAAEEAERARSQERADTAAALHDSVLQTLALIQRRSDDAGAVASLARRQERDLRDWLAGRGALGGTGGTTVARALSDAAADVESHYPLTIEVVTVGDAPCDEPLDATVAAAREALVNAARHAGVEAVDVYAEIGEDAATVFIRDRGAGFSPGSVPADRRGISESIVARMRRHGGTAAVRSSPGQGTEVMLHLPR